jgi:hypothetical protein
VVSNMTPAEAVEVDLQVSATQVVFAKLGESAAAAAAARLNVEVASARQLVSSSAKAKYSKKNQRMTVTIAAK